jgi:hypothetical protein
MKHYAYKGSQDPERAPSPSILDSATRMEQWETTRHLRRGYFIKGLILGALLGAMIGAVTIALSA